MSKSNKFYLPKKQCRKIYFREEPVKRHTHSTIAGIEDLTAVLVDISFTAKRLQIFAQALQDEIDQVVIRADNALDITNIVRISPTSYPTNDKCIEYRRKKSNDRKYSSR